MPQNRLIVFDHIILFFPVVAWRAQRLPAGLVVPSVKGVAPLVVAVRYPDGPDEGWWRDLEGAV